MVQAAKGSGWWTLLEPLSRDGAMASFASASLSLTRGSEGQQDRVHYVQSFVQNEVMLLLKNLK